MVVAVVLFVSGEQVGRSFKVASRFTLHVVATILQHKSIREEKMTLKAHLLGRKTASQHSGNHLVLSQKPFSCFTNELSVNLLKYGSVSKVTGECGLGLLKSKT